MAKEIIVPNLVESLEDAANNSADTFCSEEGNDLLDIREFEVWKECKSQFIRGANWHKQQLQPLVDIHPELLAHLARLIDRMEENELGHMSAVTRAKEAIEKAKQLKP